MNLKKLFSAKSSMKKTKTTKTNCFEILKEDLLFLQKTVHQLLPEYVENISFSVSDDSRSVGKPIKTIKIDNYQEIMNEILTNQDYSLSLFDGSLICFCYSFSDLGDIEKSSLSFLPNVESDALFRHKSFEYHGEYYLRIDYEPSSFEEFSHSNVHIHATIGKEGIRFPAKRVVLPSEFLLFILMYIYGLQEKVDAFRNSLKDNCKGGLFKSELTSSEELFFYVHCPSFGFSS